MTKWQRPEFDLDDVEVDALLERYDQTSPVLQRQITAQFCNCLGLAENHIRHLEALVEQHVNDLAVKEGLLKPLEDALDEARKERDSLEALVERLLEAGEALFNLPLTGSVANKFRDNLEKLVAAIEEAKK